MWTYVARAPVVVGGAVLALCACTGPGGSGPGPIPTVADSEPASVVVAVESVNDAVGWELGVDLLRGDPAELGGTDPPASEGAYLRLGDFLVTVDADPFSVTDSIRDTSKVEGSTALAPVAEIPAGTHTLVVWARPNASESAARACKTEVVVLPGKTAHVTVTDMPGDGRNLLPCTTT